MGKTRDLFKKIRDTKGTFHAKMGSIKDRNGKDLTEKKEEIKKRWQEYTEELYKKRFVMTQIAKFRLKWKKVGKTTRPFGYDLNPLHLYSGCDK